MAPPVAAPTTILWQNSQDGVVVSWTIQHIKFKSLEFVGSTGNVFPWQIVACGNFDSNPGIDIVWEKISNGSVFIWNIGYNTFVGDWFVGIVGPVSGWEIVTNGYFNNDSYSDHLWRNTITNDIYIWNIQNNAYSGDVLTRNSGANSGWKAKAVSEFHGRRNSDILFQNKLRDDIFIWNVTNNQYWGGRFVESVCYNSNWEIQNAGLYNADNFSDILWHNSVSGEAFIWNITNNTKSREA